MSKIFKIIIVAVFLLAGATTANAQLQGLLNAARKTATEMLPGAIAGKRSVSVTELAGTWKYVRPSLVFESDNVLQQLGGAALSGNIEKQLSQQLSRVGFKPGKLSITFTGDKKYTAQWSGEKLSGTYTLQGATLTLIGPYETVRVPVNVKIQGNQLQVAVSADKILTLVQAFGGTTPSVSAQVSAIITLLKSYKGLLIGLNLKK